MWPTASGTNGSTPPRAASASAAISGRSAPNSERFRPEERLRLEELVDRFVQLRKDGEKVDADLHRVADELHSEAERLGVHRLPGRAAVAIRRREEEWSYAPDGVRPVLERHGLMPRASRLDSQEIQRLVRDTTLDPAVCCREIAQRGGREVRWDLGTRPAGRKRLNGRFASRKGYLRILGDFPLWESRSAPPRVWWRFGSEPRSSPPCVLTPPSRSFTELVTRASARWGSPWESPPLLRGLPVGPTRSVSVAGEGHRPRSACRRRCNGKALSSFPPGRSWSTWADGVRCPRPPGLWKSQGARVGIGPGQGAGMARAGEGADAEEVRGPFLRRRPGDHQVSRREGREGIFPRQEPEGDRGFSAVPVRTSSRSTLSARGTMTLFYSPLSEDGYRVRHGSIELLGMAPPRRGRHRRALQARGPGGPPSGRDPTDVRL